MKDNFKEDIYFIQVNWGLGWGSEVGEFPQLFLDDYQPVKKAATSHFYQGKKIILLRCHLVIMFIILN